MKKITVKPCKEYGCIWFNFRAKKGSLLVTSETETGKVRIIVEDFCPRIRPNFGKSYETFFYTGNGKWKRWHVSTGSVEGKAITIFLKSYNGIVSSHYPAKEERLNRTPYKGLAGCLPYLRQSPAFNGKRTRPLSPDNCDTPAGEVNTYCWQVMYKNEPQVSYKRAGEPEKKSKA